uniref:Glycine zipper domain-containing protein n=1 Tax=Panagrolaimus sp. ES5 TaxID=591445 RepID=A0AC34F136_9BILA
MNSTKVTSPSARKELSDETKFGTAAIASSAFTGAAVGTIIIPGIGTSVGATIGAGFGFILGLIAKESNDSKKPLYEPLSGSDEDERFLSNDGTQESRVSSEFQKRY